MRHSAPHGAAQQLVDAADLSGENYRVVEELRDRVSTRLTAEDKNYAPGPRRELTRKLIRDEYGQWLLHQANHGRSAPADDIEDRIFAAVLAELDGLGRLAPLLARDDVEDIHFEGADPTMLRLARASWSPGRRSRQAMRSSSSCCARSGRGRVTGRPAESSPRRTRCSTCG